MTDNVLLSRNTKAIKLWEDMLWECVGAAWVLITSASEEAARPPLPQLLDSPREVLCQAWVEHAGSSSGALMWLTACARSVYNVLLFILYDYLLGPGESLIRAEPSSAFRTPRSTTHPLVNI